MPRFALDLADGKVRIQTELVATTSDGRVLVAEFQLDAEGLEPQDVDHRAPSLPR